MKNQTSKAIAGLLLSLPMMTIGTQIGQAQPREQLMIFHNRTRATVQEVRIWRPSRQDWSRNRIDQDLPSREQVPMRISTRGDEADNGCIYRISVRDDSGQSVSGSINGCVHKHIVFRRQSIYSSATSPGRRSED